MAGVWLPQVRCCLTPAATLSRESFIDPTEHPGNKLKTGKHFTKLFFPKKQTVKKKVPIISIFNDFLSPQKDKIIHR